MLKQEPQSPYSAIVSTATASAVIMTCGVVTGLIAARSLGPDGRGQLAALTVWSMTFVYVGDFGLPNATAYAAASERHQQDRVWTTAQALAMVFGLFVILVGWWLIPLVFIGENASLIPVARWYLVLFAVPSIGASVAHTWLHGVGRIRALNLSRPTVQLVNATGMAIVFIAGTNSVASFAAVLLVGNASGWLVATALGPGKQAMAAPPSAPLARRMLGYGVRTQWGNWAIVANERLDQLLLSIFTPAASLGLYVVALRYAMLLQVVANTTAMAMWPGMVAAHRVGAAPAYITRWYRRLLWVMLPTAVIVAGLSAFVSPLLFGEAFSSGVPLALLLVPAVIFLGMNEILSGAFHGIGRPEIVSASQVVGLVVTVAALTALLPSYGAYGAAVASLLSYGSTHAFLLRKTRRTFGISMRSLVVPTHDDGDVLRAAGVALIRHLRRQQRPAGLNS